MVDDDKPKNDQLEGGTATQPTEEGDKLKKEADDAAQKTDLPKDMSAGPVNDRECTDLICCFVFLAFLVGMVGVSSFGLAYGDPKRFLIMWDADARGCGNHTDAIDYPYLYFPMINMTEV